MVSIQPLQRISRLWRCRTCSQVTGLHYIELLLSQQCPPSSDQPLWNGGKAFSLSSQGAYGPHLQIPPAVRDDRAPGGLRSGAVSAAWSVGESLTNVKTTTMPNVTLEYVTDESREQIVVAKFPELREKAFTEIVDEWWAWWLEVSHMPMSGFLTCPKYIPVERYTVCRDGT